ncbi:hypothetical protein K4039_24350, partial [Lyngbya sp. CCAP 1446/10]|uniref:hypothetical protein n=1 Tax=Lyngbya sp. CCAP 1446/10 TaxID=439293 RepID=UPI002237C47C
NNQDVHYTPSHKKKKLWDGPESPSENLIKKTFAILSNVFIGSSDDILPPFQIVEVEEGNSPHSALQVEVR